MDFFIVIAVFFTSLLSGVFGMAGGMLLMLVLLLRMPLADAMVLTAGHCTATRWASSLRDASATAPSARAAVATLTALLPRLQPGQQGLHALLDVLHEESLRYGIAVTDPALRSWLRSLSGSSRSARAARALLA